MVSCCGYFLRYSWSVTDIETPHHTTIQFSVHTHTNEEQQKLNVIPLCGKNRINCESCRRNFFGKARRKTPIRFLFNVCYKLVVILHLIRNENKKQRKKEEGEGRRRRGRGSSAVEFCQDVRLSHEKRVKYRIFTKNIKSTIQPTRM